MRDVFLIQKINTMLGRIFTKKELVDLTTMLGITSSASSYLLNNMVKNGVIKRLFRGHYTLASSLLNGSPLHGFEIASALAPDGALACWNAMVVHELTDQFPQIFYIMTPTFNHTSQYVYTIDNKEFVLIRVQKIFGLEKRFIHESPFWVTDLERTLLDGLAKPQYCGGFFEVIHAFERASARLSVEKILEYASCFGKSTQKRLGWVLETLSLFPEAVSFLKSIPTSSVYRLDLTQNNQGEWLPDWNLRRNF